jgi:hypothetical protein
MTNVRACNHLFLIAALALAAAACGDDDAVVRDAGPGGTDSGTPVDAGPGVDAGDVDAGPGGGGECTDATNLAAVMADYDGASYAGVAGNCARGMCIGFIGNAEMLAECTYTCLQEDTMDAASEGCATCFVDTVVCSATNCAGDCVVDTMPCDPETPSTCACEQCQCDNDCISDFVECTGIPTDTCDGL